MELINLNSQELKKITGGCFAWDAGWFIRSVFRGTTAAGAAISVSEYYTHYMNGDNCTK
jgi:hypothetical protein